MNSQENALEKGQFAEEQAAAETVAEVQNNAAHRKSIWKPMSGNFYLTLVR